MKIIIVHSLRNIKKSALLGAVQQYPFFNNSVRPAVCSFEQQMNYKPRWELGIYILSNRKAL
jgi:hypothetical protein